MAYNKIITKHDYDFKMTKKFNRHYIMTHSIFMYLIFALGLFSLYSLLTGEKPNNDEMFAYYLQWSIAIIGILFVLLSIIGMLGYGVAGNFIRSFSVFLVGVAYFPLLVAFLFLGLYL